MKKLVISIAGLVLLVGFGVIFLTHRIPIDRTQASITTLAQMCNQLEKEGIKMRSLKNRDVYTSLINTSSTAEYEYYPVDPNEDALVDAWGNHLRFYRNKENNIASWSSGPDGKFDENKNGDDILSSVK